MGCRLSWLTRRLSSVAHDGSMKASQKALPRFPPKPAAPRSQACSPYPGVVPVVVVPRRAASPYHGVVVVVVVCGPGGDGRDASVPP